jgi:hypothetical protein
VAYCIFIGFFKEDNIQREYYGNSVVKALQTTFPEVKWQEDEFRKVSRGYWKDAENQKKFLQKFTQENLKSQEDWRCILL